jgi:hypothetical protein
MERTNPNHYYERTHPFTDCESAQSYTLWGRWAAIEYAESTIDIVAEYAADYDHLGDLQREHNETQNKLAATMLCEVRMFGETDDSMKVDTTSRDEKETACWTTLRGMVADNQAMGLYDTKDTNPKDSIGCTKPPLHTVPTGPLFEAGAVLLHGHCKYRGYNWRVAGVRSSIYYDAVMRHMMAWWEGENTDPDSGLPHIAHAISGLCVLRDSQMIGNCTDDRPPRRQHPFNALRPLVAEMAQKPQPEPYTEQNTAQSKSPA